MNAQQTPPFHLFVLQQANLLANIPLPPSSSAEDGGGQSSSSSSFAAADGGPSSAKKPRGGGVREWDRGKPVIGGGMGYTRWIAAQRDERDDDFRPPNFYYSK
jgi:hypothetical protein